MIDKMTKYSFILLSGDQEKFLEEIRDLGVVDITRSSKPVDRKSADMLDKASDARKALGIIGKADYSKSPDFKDIEAKVSEASARLDGHGAEDLIKAAFSASEAIDSLTSEYDNVRKEMKSRMPWGEFDKSRLDSISAAGYDIRYYSVSRKSFRKEWGELVPLQVISENNDTVWFVTVSPKGKEYGFPVQETAAPQGSWKESEAELSGIRDRINGQKAILSCLRSRTGDIESEYQNILANLDLYLAGSAGESSSENLITSFTGFAPEEEQTRLCTAFDGMDVYYFKEDAVEADNPPIKLKNNKFIRMFEVLTGMYGMPVYSEFDPTPILGPFFLLFFAMCLGDAGYGILLIIIGYLLKKKMPSMASMAPLVMTLGGATVVIGTILGSFFGISLSDASWVPSWLKSIMLTGTVGSFSIQMVLAICIGIFHISLAMVVKALCYTKRFGLKATISNWAWNLLIIGCIIIGGMALTGVIDEEVTRIAIIAVGCVSALGIFIFNKPGRNPVINIGSGLWDTYNMATGLMGDVLSYIRLYALGLAGGMLGMAFNNIATMVLDGVPVPGLNWVFFIVILLFGHALNLAMSCLGAFVHPLRLTFVEYFKNSGYEGTGKRYNPLTNNK